MLRPQVIGFVFFSYDSLLSKMELCLLLGYFLSKSRPMSRSFGVKAYDDEALLYSGSCFWVVMMEQVLVAK